MWCLSSFFASVVCELFHLDGHSHIYIEDIRCTTYIYINRITSQSFSDPTTKNYLLLSCESCLHNDKSSTVLKKHELYEGGVIRHLTGY